MKRTLAAAAIVAGAVLFGAASPAAAADNLIVNGGFDGAGYDSNGGKFTDGQNFDGWAVEGIRTNGVAPLWIWSEALGEPVITYASPFTEGPWARLMGTVEQAIPTEAGKTYVLEYKTRASGSDPNNMAGGWAGGNTGWAHVDGIEVDQFRTTTDQLYTERSVSFTATGDTTYISFSARQNGGAIGIDSVSVVEVPTNDSPVMVPAIAGGIGVALLAAGSAVAVRRKNQRSAK